MKKRLQTLMGSLMLVPAMVLGLSVALPAAPAVAGNCATGNLNLQSGADCAQGNKTPNDLFAQNGVFRIIVNILLFIIGAIAVIMLIIGGVRYVISGGDQNAVTAAKNTILYAIVGIVVAFLAYAAVNFILDSLSKAS